MGSSQKEKESEMSNDDSPMKNTMTPEQEGLLTEIHELALNEDHLQVPYSADSLTMANAVIKKMQAKLLNIAELIQVACGD